MMTYLILGHASSYLLNRENTQVGWSKSSIVSLSNGGNYGISGIKTDTDATGLHKLRHLLHKLRESLNSYTTASKP